MTQRFDVIVAGLGAMGSATAARLALRGQRVLGLERWAPGHTWGSSHGDSRIIREMYFEHPSYVPLVQRSYELWRDVEERTGTSILHLTGGLMVGQRTSALITGTMASAAQHALPYELIDAAEVHARFPAFTLPEGMTAIFDPRAGYVAPETGIAAHYTIARKAGADLRFDEPVTAWRADGDGVLVTTSKGTYRANQLCLSIGAYTNELVPELELPLTVERQVLFWLEPGSEDARWDAPACPIWVHENARGQYAYGFPRLARGVKVSHMHEGELSADAASIRRDIGDDELTALRNLIGPLLPGLRTAAVRESVVCLFTNTPDLHFLIAHHPVHPQVLLSSPCSGHGYKFASAMGEVQAELLLTGTTRFDLSMFGVDRFAR